MCTVTGCTYRVFTLRDLLGECCPIHREAPLVRVDVPLVPACRMFVDGIGDAGLPLRFMLRWNLWRLSQRVS